MQVVDLDGNTYNWNLTGYIAKGKLTNKSSLHILARQLISELFPTLQILEEVPINIKKQETLYLDFYLPLKKLCIETHGEQHYKFVPFYHNNLLSFLKAQRRDKQKQEWCEINGIKYIAFPHYENIQEWRVKLENE